MDTRRAVVMHVLEQLVKAVRELSDEDFDKLMNGDLEASISFVRPATRTRQWGEVAAPPADEALEAVHAKLTAAGSREEGQRIVEAAFADKERLFAFAKYLDLPVQRTDTVKRIREKVVTHTVGRRLSGRAVRGDGGGIASGEGG